MNIIRKSLYAKDIRSNNVQLAGSGSGIVDISANVESS